MNKDNITIVIPTHYRHKYLERLLEYYKDSGFKILVADSTNEEFYKKNDFDVFYFHYPDITFFYKMQDIVKKVDTDYVVLCADDDFIVKESLLECLDFLEKNQDYSSVQGRYIGFSKHDDEIEFKTMYFNKKDFKVEYNGVFPRLSEFMNNYVQIFYAVHKTEHLSSFFIDSYNYEMHNPILLEIGLCMYAIISGKHKTLESFYAARDTDSTSSDVDRTTLDFIVEDIRYKDVLESFLKMISKFINKKDPDIMAEEVANAGIKMYCDRLRFIKRGAERRKKLYEKRVEEENSEKDNNEVLKQHKFLRIKRGYKQLKNLKGYPLDDKVALKYWNEIKLFIT